ncbi:DMT family transporter [Alicyclobacillus acidiphilus]|uniref:DMT family transporter n=1 Tax=Alicyclobacillus acidiphilus TaxID=182455 RepID=UPI00082E5FDE|nr:DMT family transporter [Alicyclobacillus acidiphilus]
MKQISTKQTVLLVAFLVVMWGINWPLSKTALQYTPPILFAGIRTLLGGLALLIIALPRLKSLRFRENWYIYLISCLLNIVLFYGLQTVGLGYLPAGLFSAIVFLQPVLLGIMAWLWLGESMHGLKIVGLVLGVVGVAVISLGSLAGVSSPIGIVLALGTSFAWAIGTVYVKKAAQHIEPLWLVTVQLIVGGLFMTGIGTGVERWSAIHWTGAFIWLLLVIALLVIAAGWLVYFTLIGSGEATKVGSFTFLIPLISALVSAVFLHERVTISLILGLLLILASIYFVNRPRPASRSKSAPTA